MIHVTRIQIRDYIKTRAVTKALIEFFNNSDAIFNFEHIAMHCGLSRVIQLF